METSANDIQITPKQRIKASLMRDDLEVQAMIFDMHIDIETWSLEPNSTYKEAIWITRWKEKRNGSDFDERFDVDQQ